MSEEEPKFGNVMIIDDNAIDRYITSRMVMKNKFGKKVLEYCDARKALQYLQENQQDLEAMPQVILVDIYMPLMSGLEFLEGYAELPRAVRKRCKIYVISSSLDEEDIQRVNEDENITAFEEKPITKQFFERIAADDG